MDPLHPAQTDAPGTPSESEKERQRRLAWEAALIAEADAISLPGDWWTGQR